MKKVLAFALAGLFLTGIAAFAATEDVTVPLARGNNLITASQVPIDSTPTAVFKDINGNQITVESKLQRWDINSVPAKYRTYTTAGATAFGNILLGDGYWINVPAATTWKYTAVPNGIPDAAGNKCDVWIPLPKKGNTLIGNPFSSDIVWGNCMLTNGTLVLSIADATNATKCGGTAWLIGGQLQYWDASAIPAKYKYVYYDSAAAGEKNLKAGRGYWLNTNVANLALIVPRP